MTGALATIPSLTPGEAFVSGVRRRLEAQSSAMATMRLHMLGTEDQLNDNEPLDGNNIVLFALPCVSTYPDVKCIPFRPPIYTPQKTQWDIRTPLVVNAPPFVRRVGDSTLLEIPQNADGAAFCRFLQQCETVLVTHRRRCISPILLTHSRYPLRAPRIDVTFLEPDSFSPDAILPEAARIALTSIIKQKSDTVGRLLIRVMLVS